ncbi:MAG: phage terminase large subunit family protein [Caldilineaceae bacterium]|nr:phage terminase large subunit family protein [Caldilineaceae bacterium]
MSMHALAPPERYREAALSALAPDPRETVSEWADQYMRLPSESAEPGRWRTSRFPFIREIMDCLSPLHPIREVVLMKPIQLAGTSAGICWMGHTIHRAPCNMLIVEPTVDLAKKLSKQRVDSMVELVPEVQARVKERKARDAGNTTFEKEYLGGRLVFTGANSGVGLRFMSAKNLMLDEVDAYPASVDDEGAPVDLAERRVATFPRHKIFKLSTPLKKETSVIEPEYLDSDQRKYFVPCPFCAHGQVLTWAGLKWPTGKPELVGYECEQCHQLIPEYKKPTMLEQGQWLSTLAVGDWAGLSSRKAGFWINILYQPYGMVQSWSYLAREWTDIAHTKNLEKMQAFVNTYWAETWEEKLGDKLDYKDLWNRREIYPAPVPQEVKVITAFADVQHDRIEAEARGWGPGKESWGLGLRVFLGSPADLTVDGPWAKLEQWFQQRFEHPVLGPLRIMLMGIDSGDGNYTKEVYDFVRPRQGHGIIATKGSNQPTAHLLAGRGKHKETGTLIYSIGTDAAKDSIYANLKLTEPGPGYFHWPQQSGAYDEEYFQQVCAEAKVSVKKLGRIVGTKYKKLRDRNEGLDLLVGNWFIVELTGVDLNQYTFDYREPQPNAQQRAQQADRGGWIRTREPGGGPRAGGRSGSRWMKR